MKPNVQDHTRELQAMNSGVVDRDGNRIRQNMSVYAEGVVWNVRHALPSMIVLNRTKDDGGKMTMLLGRNRWRLISIQGWFAGDWPKQPAKSGSLQADYDRLNFWCQGWMLVLNHVIRLRNHCYNDNRRARLDARIQHLRSRHDAALKRRQPLAEALRQPNAQAVPNGEQNAPQKQ